MLAQRRMKVTWTLNPRGRLWSDGKTIGFSSKF